MKRVNFGHKGGFPLEQETLIHLQRAYADDMLEALMARWSFDSNKTYLIKEASATEDGWIITKVARNETNPQSGESFAVVKSELLRLKFNGGIKNKIEKIDLRAGDSGILVYADGSTNRVYEEWIARYSDSGDIDVSTEVFEVPKVEDLLPRDGSKPMTGDLNLSNNDLVFNKADNDNIDHISYGDGSVPTDPNKPNPGYFDFVADGSKGDKGNAWLRSGGLVASTGIGIGVTLPTKPLEINAAGNTLKVTNLDAVSSQTALVIDSDGNVGRGTTGVGGFQLGMIMMWSGAIDEIPTGWALCNGVGGTPNLSGRFIVGYSAGDSDYNAIGDNGGEKTVRLTTAQMPSHSHTGSTGANGAHSHTYQRSIDGRGYETRADDQPHGAYSTTNTSSVGNHTHSLSINATGGGQPHENRPPYYTLAFIIYVGDDFVPTKVQAIERVNIQVSSDNRYSVTAILKPGFENLDNAAFHWETISGGTNTTGITIGYGTIAPGTYNLTVTPNPRDTYAAFSFTLTAQATPFIRVVPTSLGSSIPRAGGTYDVTIESNRPWERGIGIVGVTLSQASGNGGETIKLTVPENTGTSPRQGSLQFKHVSGSLNATVGWNQLGATITPAPISLNTNRINFEEFELLGEQRVELTTNLPWEIITTNNSVSVQPSSSILTGQRTETIRLYLDMDAQELSGSITFQTIQAGTSGQAILNWTAIMPNSDGGGGGLVDNCFDLESNVVMANGRSKKLRNIVVGDKLRGYDFPNRIDANSETYIEWSGMLKEATIAEVVVKDMIVKTVDSYVQLTMLDGTILNITKGHPLLVSKDQVEVSWIKPSELRSGLFLIDKDGKPKEIESKKTINKSLEIGVLDVENIDNYMIQGFIVHNAEIVRNTLTDAVIDVQK